MKRVVIGVLMGLLLMGFASSSSYAEKSGGVQGEKGRHEECAPRMGHMGHRGMGMMWAGHRIGKALADLGLDEKQKEAIKDIRTIAKKDAIRKIADIRIARIELREILDKDPVDMGAVEAKLKQLESLKTDMHMSRIKTLEEIKAKLTPEQRQKFKINLRRQFRRHGGWRHEGKGMRSECAKRGKK
ncbi:MAG: Spy/CpxP family protein refolding chaperone [Thermodesulfovibrionales bacterium]